MGKIYDKSYISLNYVPIYAKLGDNSLKGISKIFDVSSFF